MIDAFTVDRFWRKSAERIYIRNSCKNALHQRTRHRLAHTSHNRISLRESLFSTDTPYLHTESHALARITGSDISVAPCANRCRLSRKTRSTLASVKLQWLLALLWAVVGSPKAIRVSLRHGWPSGGQKSDLWPDARFSHTNLHFSRSREVREPLFSTSVFWRHRSSRWRVTIESFSAPTIIMRSTYTTYPLKSRIRCSERCPISKIYRPR